MKTALAVLLFAVPALAVELQDLVHRGPLALLARAFLDEVRMLPNKAKTQHGESAAAETG